MAWQVTTAMQAQDAADMAGELRTTIRNLDAYRASLMGIVVGLEGELFAYRKRTANYQGRHRKPEEDIETV